MEIKDQQDAVVSTPLTEVPSAKAQAEKADDEVSLKELLLKVREWYRYVLSKWLVILVAGLIGGLIGLAFAFYKKPVYKAELSFALEDEKSGSGGIGGALGLVSQFGIDLGGSGGGAFSGDNLLELMKSRTMVQKTLLTDINISGQKGTLVQRYIDFNNFKKKWADKSDPAYVRFPAGINSDSLSRIQDSLLGEFHKDIIEDNLSVDKLDKKLSIISVKIKSKDEIFSKYFTEILVKNVSDFYVETKTKKSLQNVNILQHQTDSVRRQLNGAISGVASSMDANPNANPSRLMLKVPSQRRQVDVQANTAILTELVKNLELSKVSLRKETPLIQVIDYPILPLQVEKINKVLAAVVGIAVFMFFTILFLIVKRLLSFIVNEHA